MTTAVKPQPDIIEKLEQSWPKHMRKKNDLYLYWNRKDSENHGHVFLDSNIKKWYYNIKCNNNRGKERINHKLSKTKKAHQLTREIKHHWKKECPQFVKKKRTHKKTHKISSSPKYT
jgi:hypothetical protein